MPRARVQQRARGPQSYGGRGGPLHRSRHSLAADLSRPPFELANPALAAISTRLALRTCSMVATRPANLSRCVLRCGGSRWANSALIPSAQTAIPLTCVTARSHAENHTGSVHHTQLQLSIYQFIRHLQSFGSG